MSRQPDRAAELADAVVVQFPLRGEWMAAHSPGSRIPSHGTNQLGQRYAYDLWRVDEKRRYHPAGALKTWTLGVPTSECYGWGEPVHAVLDGQVERARDGTRQRRRLHPIRELLLVIANGISFRPTPQAIDRILGNQVVIRSGGVRALFAHLAPGSVAVRDGQTVRRGDVIGRVGSTGNSTAPHLHFQLMDRLDPTTAKAIPAAFDTYEVWHNGRWEPLRDAVPLTSDRIRCGDGASDPS